MGPAYFVIAILGCADGGSACTKIATLETRYSSEAECTAATPAALIENSKFDYPTLVASCRPDSVKSADSQRQGASKHRHS
ncbi:MAG TPA: hypothetical protein VHS33_02205 [Sphingomicrobium sp.]|jgi:hypothetical protein|nr:hypothetical protein [Sphingomicrobium sp.]